MERLANRLSNNIALSLGCDEEQRAVIAYGLTGMLQIVVTTVLVLLLGFVVGAPAEAMIVCFSVSILRKYSGGAHAGSLGLCTLVSLVYCTLTAVASRAIAEVYLPGPMAAFLIVLYGLSGWILYRRVPVESPNKPIRSEQKRKRMRKYSFAIYGFYLLLSVCLFIGSMRWAALRPLGLSLMFGLGWQMVTLTSFGSNLLNKLNGLLLLFGKEADK